MPIREDHTGDAYVSFGRMNILYMLISSFDAIPKDLSLRNMCRRKEAEFTTVVTWGTKVSLWSMVTPSNLKVSTVSRAFGPMVRAGGGGGIFETENGIVTDLSGFIVT